MLKAWALASRKPALQILRADGSSFAHRVEAPQYHEQKSWLMYEMSEQGAQINRFLLTDSLFQFQ
jgi:hypothetical protein